MNTDILKLKELSLTEYKKNHYQKAIDGFSECISLLDGTEDDMEIAELKNNICVAYIQLNDAQKAFEAVINTEQFFEKYGNVKLQAMALANSGTVLEMLARYEEALSHFEHSLELFKSIGEDEMRSLTLRKVADLQRKTGRNFQAIASLEASYNQGVSPSLKDNLVHKLLVTIRRKFIK